MYSPNYFENKFHKKLLKHLNLYTNLNQRPLIINFYNLNKFYDTTTKVFASYTISNIIYPDYIDISNIYTINYNNANAGNKTIIYKIFQNLIIL